MNSPVFIRKLEFPEENWVKKSDGWRGARRPCLLLFFSKGKSLSQVEEAGQEIIRESLGYGLIEEQVLPQLIHSGFLSRIEKKGLEVLSKGILGQVR